MSVDAAMKFIGELPNGHKVYWADDRFEQPGIHVWNGSTHDHYAIKPTPTDTADRREAVESALAATYNFKTDDGNLFPFSPTNTADRREAVAHDRLWQAMEAEISTWERGFDPETDIQPPTTDDYSAYRGDWVAKAAVRAIAPLIAVPDGMCIVPREPTEAMLCAWATSDKFKDDWRADCRSGWSAMIAAATGEAS